MMATNAKKKIITPPWYRDGTPERWVTSGRFARLMNRARSTVHLWIANGTLEEFGFAYYRDPSGYFFIRISAVDLVALRRIEGTCHSKQSDDCA
jgi:hypothetical protein